MRSEESGLKFKYATKNNRSRAKLSKYNYTINYRNYKI